MPRVDNFFLTTDFDTLKNDGSATVTVTIPSSTVVAASSTLNIVGDVNVGTPASVLIVSATNNVDYPLGDYVSVINGISSQRTGSAPYSIVARFSHVGGNTVRCYLNIFNNSASALTTSATPDIWTFRIRTIRVPKFT